MGKRKISKKEIEILLKEGGVVDTEPLFVMAYHEFIRDPKLTVYEKMVFLSLKTYAGDKNSCFPGQTTISKELGISIDSIGRSLKTLEEKGALLSIRQVTTKKRKTTNLYILAKYNPDKQLFESKSLEKFKCLKENPLVVSEKNSKK